MLLTEHSGFCTIHKRDLTKILQNSSHTRAFIWIQALERTADKNKDGRNGS